MAYFSPDPRMVILRGLIASKHAFPGNAPEARSQIIVEILQEAITLLTHQVADNDLWRELFELLGQAHPAQDRFDIVVAVLTVLHDIHDTNPSNLLAWAQAWILTISTADIHPASLVLCTAHRFQYLGRTLVPFVNMFYPQIHVSRQFPPFVPHGQWMIQLNTDVGPQNILAVGHVVAKEGGRVGLTNLGEGWVVGGNLELRCCRDLQHLGPALTVLQFLRFDGCRALNSSQQGVKVAFRIEDVTGFHRERKSGYLGIQSNIGFYIPDRNAMELFRWHRHKVSRVSIKNPGAALPLPHSFLLLL